MGGGNASGMMTEFDRLTPKFWWLAIITRPERVWADPYVLSLCVLVTGRKVNSLHLRSLVHGEMVQTDYSVAGVTTQIRYVSEFVGFESQGGSDQR